MLTAVTLTGRGALVTSVIGLYAERHQRKPALYYLKARTFRIARQPARLVPLQFKRAILVIAGGLSETGMALVTSSLSVRRYVAANYPS